MAEDVHSRKTARQAQDPVCKMIVDVENAFVQPWVNGYYRSPFATYFKYIDIDMAKKREASAR